VLRNEQDKTYRMVGSCVDITDPMEIQNHMREAKEHAESANKAKTRFLANMSHEIRTPINAIIGMNYLLGQTALDERQLNLLKKVNVSTEQLLGIVTDILDFSKIEAGKTRLERISFDLNKILVDVYESNRVQAEKKGIDFTVEMRDEVEYYLVGDPLRLEQILNNLVNNAIKFTIQGSVALKVKVLGVEEHDIRLEFVVQDTGIGLSELQMSTVFQAFNQGDNSTTRNFGGTGLGLKICQELTALMKGNLSVDSHIGIGSQFTVQLKFTTDKLKLKPIHISPIIPNLQETTRILVAEDNELNQELISLILKERGAQVIVASNGLEAVRMIEQQAKVDIVLMDIQMPVMDGKEAGRLIRKIKGYEELPIIAMTADATKGFKEELLKAGFNDYIAKPFHVPNIVEILLKWEKNIKAKSL
jgi:CheY-like chemotaxis protein